MDRWQLPCDPLVALQAGDPEPFEHFVRTHARTLIAYFRQRGATPSRSEELAQEAFLKLYQGAARYRPEERFAAYCFRVARNLWIDECRRAGARAEAPRASEDEPDPAAPGGDPGADLARRDEETRLRRLLATLSDPHREVFELAVLGELGYAEVSAVLGIPVGTVKSRMFHAVRRLRAAWVEAYGEPGASRAGGSA